MVGVPTRILEAEGLPRYRALKSELEQVRTENTDSQRRVDQLTREVLRLRTDVTAIEESARRDLGLVRPGEIVFQFDDR